MKKGSPVKSYKDLDGNGVCSVFARDVESAERRLSAAVERDDGPFAGYAARLRVAVMDAAASPDDVAILALRFG